MRKSVTASVFLFLAALSSGSAGRADDTLLFTANVTPNVLMLLDNSGSMNNIVWHPDFDPAAATTCNVYVDAATYFFNNDTSVTQCGKTRTIYHDTSVNPEQTRYTGKYLNWLFSPEADAAYAQIQGNGNGFPSSCVGGAPYAKYKRARITAAKQAIKEIVCEVNLMTAVRFGIAKFRKPEANGDVNGGFVLEAVDDYNSTQASDINSALQSIQSNSWTPLGEALFQVYTYFMSRTDTDLPLGIDGVTPFPKYVYKTSNAGVGGAAGAANQVPDSPVQYSCQRNFIIIVTDGESTKDDFLQPELTRSAGFNNFETKLIGDYNPDNAVPEAGNEEPGSSPTCVNCSVALYLDDIAKYMHEKDFRPDMSGDQTFDIYTVGFTTTDFANELLEKAADVGNGQFYFSNDVDELADNVVAAMTDIIQKSQSFTAATVPASRTVNGGNIYISFFIPASDPGPWEGHLKNFAFTATGDILDTNGDCVSDLPETLPNPPPCDDGGEIRSNAPGYWDAADGVPTAGSRTLYVSKQGGSDDCGSDGSSKCSDFDAAEVSAADLGVVDADIVTYPTPPAPTPVAANAEELADQIANYVRGCSFGSSPCSDRSSRLGDIFHSNPILVGPPNAPLNESSYLDFATDHQYRSRVIYAGANDGFLRAFQAGLWQPGATPPAFDTGTGAELFGFMPWQIRQTIKELPIDGQPRDYYYVDGSAQVADVWFPSIPLQVSKVKTEWQTVLIGSLRQGGRSYYALDVTNPPGNPSPPAPADYNSYPTYLWEFPCESVTCDGWRPYLGQSWSDAVITRVRVSIGASDNGGQGFERWVAIFGAGYDVAGDPNDQVNYDDSNDASTSRAGRAIFMLDIATGKVLAVKKYEHTAVGAEQGMRFSIASTPAVFDLDFDGFADVIYVGDLGGNVWKWVVREMGAFTAAPGDGPTPASHDYAQANWSFTKFFTAPTYTHAGTTYYKSIYFPPTGTLKDGKLYLAFGTGERNQLDFEGFSSTTAENNRFYVMQDLDPYETLGLNPHPIQESLHLTNIDSVANCSNLSAFQGYYLLARDMEKFVSTSFIFLGDVWTGSFIPLVDADPCTAGGDTYVYRFDLECGTGEFPDEGPNPEDQRRKQIGTGIPTSPRISVGPAPDASDPNPECQSRVFMITSDGGVLNDCAGAVPSSGVKLINWRER